MNPTPEEMEQLKKDVAEIKTALIGNEEMKQEGLVHLVKKHENYIAKDQWFKAKAVGALAAIEVIGLAIFGWFLNKH